MKEISCNIYKINGFFYTKSLINDISYKEEKRKVLGNNIYREWSPYRSKMSAALHNGFVPPCLENKNILYLGAASGTTVSHFSDIIKQGIIFAVEFAPIPFRDLLELSKKRNNIFPILEDANYPNKYDIDEYKNKIFLLYQDVSQREQIDILKKNTLYFNPEYIFFALKHYSIDSVKDFKSSKEFYKKELEKKLKKYKIIHTIDISNYSKGHYFFVLKNSY